MFSRFFYLNLGHVPCLHHELSHTHLFDARVGQVSVGPTTLRPESSCIKQQGFGPRDTRKVMARFFNLRAKRGGSLFEAGSEREENGGVASVQKWCA